MPQRKGWFRIPGLQDGDRTLEQQIKGLRPALDQARGRTVLDLGSAEGLISREFALAGARRVLGLEVVAEHLEVARALCLGHPCEFSCVDLNRAELAESFDVVLMLAVIHKMREPERVLERFAGLALELIVFRMPAFWEGTAARPTTFRSERYSRDLVDVERILARQGFALERIERGPTADRGQEPVLYFRKRGHGLGG